MSEMPEKAKQTRKRGPNVQTGCKTCKIRRKKCDTTRPACFSCTSTGRTCDFLSRSTETLSLEVHGEYYTSHLPKPAKGFSCVTPHSPHSCQLPAVTPLYISPLPLPPESTPHLTYFLKACTTEFSSFFHHPLWQSLIPRAAYTEPFMLHAILAIGALRRSQLAPSPSTFDSDEMLEYSARHYDLATKELALLLAKGDVNWKTALLGSLVFLAVEVLRGHEPGALLHLRNGEAILKSLASEGYHCANGPTRKHQEAEGNFDDVVTAFTRLSFDQYPFTGLSSESVQIPSVPSHFNTLTESRTSLNAIIASMHAFHREYGHVSFKTLPTHPLPPYISLKQDTLQTTLDSWYGNFTMLLLRVSPEPEITLSRILEIQYLVASTTLATHFHCSQFVYDTHLPSFKQIVSLSRIVVDTENGSMTRRKLGPCYTLDLAMAQPLYFVVRFCREGSVRRGAIEVLRRVGGQADGKGVHHGGSVTVIAEWIVDIEEAGNADQFVPEERRLTDVEFDIRSDGRTAAAYALRRGKKGSWESFQEEIVLC